MKKIKIARIVTVPIAFVHIRAFILYLKQHPDVDLQLISSDGIYRDTLKKELDVDVNILTIPREISLKEDLKSLKNLLSLFKKSQFSIIHSSTPKAGLLTAIAGFFFPGTVRVHTFTGQRWATLTGFLRTLLKLLDRLIIKLNTQCYADSPSQIEYLISEGVAKRGEIKCINLGSYGGIDINRFDNTKYPEARSNLLKEINAIEEDVIVLYVGRMTRDKGIEELIEGFQIANLECSHLRLVLVGPYEAEVDFVKDETIKKIANDKNIYQLGFRANPEHYFSGADLFCLPSYREGFGTVVLEAAACNLLTIGTRIPGLVDSVVDNTTGILFEKKNVMELKDTIVKLAKDKNLRNYLSNNARERARKEFDSNMMAKLQWEEYMRLLKKDS
jgi:glycosyltransferase involved in cell wall biosynthesis